MIITRTPFRISFFGGGTDYPVWYKEHGGAVLSAAIDKYCYINCRRLPPFFDYNYKMVYTQVEEVQSLQQLKHPVIPAVVKYLGIENGLEIHHDADLPARSGMGSSSAFIAGLLNALHAYKGEHASKAKLLHESLDIEQNVLGENVGSQDQTSAVFGGLNQIQFLRTGHIQVDPLTVSKERMQELNDHLLLFFSGVQRRASDVAASFIPTLKEKSKQLNLMHGMVEEAITILSEGRDIQEFGRLLHESWQLKRSLGSKISNDECDDIYSLARKAGALGGKILGAGGGGFMLFFVPPERHTAVKSALCRLTSVPFHFDFMGSHILHYQESPNYDEDQVNRFAHAATAVA